MIPCTSLQVRNVCYLNVLWNIHLETFCNYSKYICVLLLSLAHSASIFFGLWSFRFLILTGFISKLLFKALVECGGQDHQFSDPVVWIYVPQQRHSRVSKFQLEDLFLLKQNPGRVSKNLTIDVLHVPSVTRSFFVPRPHGGTREEAKCQKRGSRWMANAENYDAMALVSAIAYGRNG